MLEVNCINMMNSLFHPHNWRLTKDYGDKRGTKTFPKPLKEDKGEGEVAKIDS